MSAIPPQISATAAPEKYLIAFVIQGDDVFKITADNIIHTTGTANGPAFDAIAKLKAAAALLELTNRHKERPDELRQMARELAGEGMKLMAQAASAVRPTAVVKESAAERASDPVAAAVATQPEAETQAETASPRAPLEAVAPPVPLDRPAMATGPAPLPKPELRSEDESALPGNSPTNSKIALIS